MLDATLTTTLRGHLEKLAGSIELVATLDDSARSSQLVELLDEIAALSSHITVRHDGTDERAPSFVVRRVRSAGDDNPDVGVTFAGLPMGHEFTSLVLALLQVSGYPPRVDEALAQRIAALPGRHHFETYFSVSCQNCPDVVQALNVLAVLNPSITHTSIDGAAFADEVSARGVMAVPTVLRDGEVWASGRMTLAEIVDRLDETSAAAALEGAAAQPFDVLVVGGGPAGAAAAIYAARKGIRTGLVAERIGGQVLDTMGIENLISVPHTEGPRLAGALGAHLAEYPVEILSGRRADQLTPTDADGLIGVTVHGGTTLRARSVVLAPGARWRTLGVPGEDEYRNRGVTFCPHCDGPLFTGRPVAVVGGGNSGVEAAIDLAGIASHVTLVEFADTLRADAVLCDRLHSLPNVTVITSAETTEVRGDGQRVTALAYRDRATGGEHEIAVAGIFVQIGLVPGTEWLGDVVERNERGEIVIDDRGATSLPGVFAAGDATTVPYKQIVIALGAGATAALSAFDHLIRTPVAGGAHADEPVPVSAAA